ncbi:concanavalin A-like lectin/glucanase domain-containing protein [Xylariaceae sp. FL1651]|nr:concanavalin A-like lectin/glucanase domain-containing protein [Xylariaceae sp. FL1651]
MVHLSSTFLALAIGVTSARAGLAVISNAVEERAPEATTYTSYNYTDEFSTYDFQPGFGGEFKVTWDNGFGGDFVVGKGYTPAKLMLVNYTGTFDVDGNAYLALYGWMFNPQVEYYVIEALGSHNPSDNTSATQHGCLESDGATYQIWQKERYLSGEGKNAQFFQQYWSIRTSMHVGGTITMANHFKAWEAAGMPLGTLASMDMVIEGQVGSGTAVITVGTLPTTPVPETPTPTHRTAKAAGTCNLSSSRTTTTAPSTTLTTKAAPTGAPVPSSQ